MISPSKELVVVNVLSKQEWSARDQPYYQLKRTRAKLQKQQNLYRRVAKRYCQVEPAPKQTIQLSDYDRAVILHCQNDLARVDSRWPNSGNIGSSWTKIWAWSNSSQLKPSRWPNDTQLELGVAFVPSGSLLSGPQVQEVGAHSPEVDSRSSRVVLLLPFLLPLFLNSKCPPAFSKNTISKNVEWKGWVKRLKLINQPGEQRRSSELQRFLALIYTGLGSVLFSRDHLGHHGKWLYCTTNSHYLTYRHFSQKLGRMYFLNSRVKGSTAEVSCSGSHWPWVRTVFSWPPRAPSSRASRPWSTVSTAPAWSAHRSRSRSA